MSITRRDWWLGVGLTVVLVVLLQPVIGNWLQSGGEVLLALVLVAMSYFVIPLATRTVLRFRIRRLEREVESERRQRVAHLMARAKGDFRK